MSLFRNWKFSWKDTQLKIDPGNGLCLDLGCGNGNLRPIVENRGWTYIGSDIDISRGRGGVMVQCDGLFLPFNNDSFKIVLINQVLEHIKEPIQLLREINRVLMYRGKIYGSVSYLEPFHDKCMYFGFTHKGVESILRDAGFNNIEIIFGINAFSLILRGLLIRLLPKNVGQSLAFLLAKVGIVSFVYAIFLSRAILSLIRCGRLSDSYKRIYKYITEIAPLHFAGHIEFTATAKK